MSPKYIPAENFIPHSNPEHLSSYLWNDRVVDGIFCKNCGIHPYFGNEEYGYRVNLGCVEQLDALSLKIEILDGRSMPIAEHPGPYPGN